jgi:hypothetical protein
LSIVLRRPIPLIGATIKVESSFWAALRHKLGLKASATLPLPVAPTLSPEQRTLRILQLERYLRSRGGLRFAAALLVDMDQELGQVRAENAEMDAVLEFKRNLAAYNLKHPQLKSTRFSK